MQSTPAQARIRDKMCAACVFGVTGGIAAAKASLVASALTKRGVDVQVIMTKSACEFVAPLTYRTLTGNPVSIDLFAEPGQWNVKHVSLSEAADLFVIAPATANFIGKLASGIADDLLTTTVMATRAPVLIAPAMNVGMYANPIVQRNIESLKSLGRRFIGPECGRLACGDVGVGRMAEPDRITEFAMHMLASKGRPALVGRRVVVTAGPTHEHIDPVRFIGNRSSGKMGYAIAWAAGARGAEVTLVSGPVALDRPEGCELLMVESAAQMREATIKAAREADIVIGAAAVADYRPAHYNESKIKKSDGEMNLELARTSDIIAEIGRAKGNRTVVGFAAETDDIIAHAQSKLDAKNLDMVVVNAVGGPSSPFGADENTVTILRPGLEPEALPSMTKLTLAHEILDRVCLSLGPKRG
ncbi:MAG: bifunctional phosphopantothenoylcysteine decarboxylase/phosphopantothenate--cysteine ligase CoaBC [Clostridia bacterium]|nr:bifunctional phosphopantothenoylcysteine decarboxylase/phosphopantothenate--cysteine ligase CoaBC [Clostridia bacterium]